MALEDTIQSQMTLSRLLLTSELYGHQLGSRLRFI